ncbi:MAG: toprim domain-containing protein [Pirellulaceae bacterium]|jgi:DNA gyrase/topoisomerase IV subunit B
MERRWKTHLVECSTDRRQELGELLVVEGDSAARAVLAVRDPVHQAVMAMQGKPRNAYKCSEQQIRNHPLLSQLLVAIAGPEDSAPPPTRVALQYRRIVLLMDPDADGVHAGMLLLLFFHRMIPELLEGNRLEVAIPPMLYWEEEGTWKWFRSDEQCMDEVKRRSEAGLPVPPRTRVRGLASLPRALLLESCVAKETRQTRSLSAVDAAAAMRLLVPKIDSGD